MALIETGVDFVTAQAEAAKANNPADPGVYEVQCRSVEPSKPTKEGQPRLQWTVAIINAADPSINGKTINIFTSLPHMGNFKGVKYLTDICAAFGMPWTGSSFETNDYIGKTARANVGKSQDGKWNEIVSWL